jgi:hypothetical protein
VSSLAAAGRAQQQNEAIGGRQVVQSAGHVLDKSVVYSITGLCVFLPLLQRSARFAFSPVALLLAPLEHPLSPNLLVGFARADRPG